METERKFYVYVDYREDDGTPFYVGKGTKRRVNKSERNQLHTNIKNKHGAIRKVLMENLTEEESFEWEIQLIQELETYHELGKGGANFTLGGGGISGLKRSDETKEKLKKVWEDPEHREKMCNLRRGLTKKLWEDPVYREKMCEIRKNLTKKLWEDSEHREKIKKMWEDPEKRSKNGEYSKKLWEDPEHREKMSETLRKRWENPENKKNVSEKVKSSLEKLTPEQRSERTRKSWETRRLKKLQSEG
jgi:hypothetical protein